MSRFFRFSFNLYQLLSFLSLLPQSCSLLSMLRFVSIALGSLAELETQVMLAGRFQYLSENELQPLLSQTDEIHRMLRGLQKALKAKT